MNKKCYRIIFNRQKGQLVVVSELTNQHKNTTTTSSTPQRATAKLRQLYLMICMILGSAVMVDPVFANIVADKAASSNEQPQIMQTSNGIPQVNIQTPGKNGVSHNKYSQFDVDQKGAILNNARQPTKTELAGYVTGNANLAKGGAKIILNEVNASSPSQLKGFIEVAGEKAQVIIANTSGIICDGCGFINADKATLTTGKPQMENDQLKGYNVQQGKIRIIGKGLNTRKQNYTEIVARSVEVNAGIWGNDIKVITGRNHVSADLNTITANNDEDQDKPQLAIDVAELGGMYADKIHLVGTEKGVGVSNAGQLGICAGSISVTANGKIVNNGIIHAKQQIELTSKQNIENNKSIYSQHDINLTTEDHIVNKGELIASNDITLKGKNITSTAKSIISAGMNETNKLTQKGNINIKADDIVLHGQNTANNTLSILANYHINLDESISYADKIDIAGKTLSLQQANLQSDKVFSLSNLSEINSSYSTIIAKDGIFFEADRLTNDNSKLIAEGDIQLIAKQLENNQSDIATNNNLQIDADTIQSQNAKLRAKGDIQLIAKQLENNQSDIATNNNLQIDADTIQSQNAKLRAKGDIQLTANQIAADEIDIIAEKALTFVTKQLSTIAGHLQSKQALMIKADEFYQADNVNIITDDSLFIESSSLTSNQSKISTLGLLSVNATLLQNQDSVWLSDKDIVVNADNINNQSSLMKATHGLNFTFNTLNNDNAQFTSGGEINLSGNSLINRSAYITAKDNLLIDVEKINNDKSQLYSSKSININSDDIDNHEAIIIADENLNLKSNKLNNQQAQIKTGGDLAIELSDQLINEKAKLISGKAITIIAQTILNQQALLSAGLQIYLKTQSINNNGGNIQSQDNITLIADSFDNQFARLIAGIGGISITADRFDNQFAKLIAGEGGLSITAPQWKNNEASLLTTGELILNSEELDNTKATLVTEKSLIIDANQLNNTEGELKAKGNLIITANQLSNFQATLISESDINLKINDELVNEAAQLTALGRVTLSTNDILYNKGAQIKSGNGIEITSNELKNQSAKLTTIGDLIIHASDIYTPWASLTADNIDITTNDFINDWANITANQNLTLIAKNNIYNNQGQLLANNIILSSDQLINNGSIKAQNDIELVLFGSLFNQNEIISNGNLSIFTPHFITNENKIVARNSLTLNSTQLENHFNGEISANNLAITNSDLLNDGLIDGNTVFIKTTNLKNLATGSIYGDDLTIQTEILNNQANKDQAPAIIAARKDFKLGVQKLNNSGHGRLLSLGNFTIGGQIDQNGQVINQAQEINNHSSTIQANGDLQLNVNQLNNINDHIVTEEQSSGEQPEQVHYFKVLGSDVIFNVDDLEFQVKRGKDRIYLPWSELSDYEKNSSNFRFIRLKGTNWQTYQFFHYNYYKYKYNNVIRESDPALITAANNITINSQKLYNKDSKIIAGNTLTLNVREIENSDVENQHRITSAGYVSYHYRKNSRYRTAWNAYSEPDVIITTPDNKNISDHQPVVQATLEPVQRTPTDVAITTNEPELNYNINANTENQSTQGEISLTGSNIDDSHLSAQNNKVEYLTPIIITEPNITLPNINMPDCNPSCILGEGGKPPDYITETYPRFTDKPKWLSSDYMQNILKSNPDQTQKRLSDGYYEKQTILEHQGDALFNQQDLGTHQNNLKHYQEIINSGIEFARPYEISIDATLSSEQMSIITSNTVWNVSHNIILDGETYQVLVPQSYLITGSPISVDNGFLTSKDIPKHNTWDFLNNNEMISSEENVNSTNVNNPNQDSSMKLDIIVGDANGILVGSHSSNLDEISKEQRIDKNEKDKILYQENEEPKPNKITPAELDIEVVKGQDDSSLTGSIKPMTSVTAVNIIHDKLNNDNPVSDLSENEKIDINALNILAEGLAPASGNNIAPDNISIIVVENKVPVENKSANLTNSHGIGVLQTTSEGNHNSIHHPSAADYLTQQKLDQLFKDINSGMLFKDITFDMIFKNKSSDILIYDPEKKELKKVPKDAMKLMNPYSNNSAFSEDETLEDYAISVMGILPIAKSLKLGGKLINVEGYSAQSLAKKTKLARQQLKSEGKPPIAIVKNVAQLMVQEMVFIPTQLKIIQVVIPYTQIISLIILLNTV